MKKIVMIIFLLVNSTGFAKVKTNVEIKVGTGKYICTAEGIKKNPSLVRSNSRADAEDLALDECAKIEGKDIFCKIKKCEEDPNANNVNINIEFSIKRAGQNININLNNGVAGYRCRTKAFRKRYRADAPTRLEAEILVRKTCINDGNRGMHCKKVKDCVKLENQDQGSGSISVKDGKIDVKGAVDLFKKWKKK